MIRTPKDIQRVSLYYKSTPSKMQTEELPRMEKVIKTFPVIKKVEIGFILVGIFLLLLFGNNGIIKRYWNWSYYAGHIIVWI